MAWRVLYVLMLGRECPKMRCDAVLSEAAAAHAYVESRRAFGRVVLIP